jgi:CRISPR/Cas system-associated exonuclease Cas4 (RecB family)
MGGSDIYRREGPTAWAGPPAAFSFSNLKRMGICLRQWQLGRSAYGEHNKYPERPSEAAEVGKIVHDLLSRLFHALALAGYPALGSEDFRQVLHGVDVAGKARSMLETFAQEAANSPRALGFRLQATPRDVFNQVAQAFREEYTRVLAEAARLMPIPRADSTPPNAGATPADRLHRLVTVGVLSEEEVRHPRLPLLGIIDLLVRRDGRTTVLDFKTGASRPEHREQIQLYALMWWRSTGDLPASVELRYGARVEAWPVSKDELCGLEEDVAARIARHESGLSARPAAASVGPHCAGCSVRQLCSDYWTSQSGTDSKKDGERVDRQLVVWSSGAKAGFVGRDAQGRELTVVFDDDVAAFFGPFVRGEKLRILGGQLDSETGALRLTRGSEVFRCT